jgi:hypothetical protein
MRKKRGRSWKEEVKRTSRKNQAEKGKGRGK